MKKIVLVAFVVAIAGCSTVNSVPYKASTANVINIQTTLKESGKKVNLGDFVLAPGVDANQNCRMLGPVQVSPGKPVTSYVRDAFQEELFMAGVYDIKSPHLVSARIEKLTYSSVSPASWEVTMSVKSDNFDGYTVAVKYPFDTSFAAVSACKNVADAFAPAVSELLKKVVANPQFGKLAN